MQIKMHKLKTDFFIMKVNLTVVNQMFLIYTSILFLFRQRHLQFKVITYIVIFYRKPLSESLY